MDREKLIIQIMNECKADGEPVTREEAEEMADMELKAKGIKRYEQSEPTTAKKPKAKKEVKIDAEKVEIIKILEKALTDAGFGAIIVNEQREIAFNDFSVTLTKHRKKK